jgi:hypothetical protein
MISKADFAPIATLDFSVIKATLMSPAGRAWSRQRANAVECEYRRFLYLMKMFPQEPTAPLADVDLFWRHHLLDTLRYAGDCQRIFGQFLHYFPYAGMRGAEDEAALLRMGGRMRVIYESTFEETYPGADSDRQVRPHIALAARVPAAPAFLGSTSATGNQQAGGAAPVARHRSEAEYLPSFYFERPAIG